MHVNYITCLEIKKIYSLKSSLPYLNLATIIIVKNVLLQCPLYKKVNIKQFQL